MTNQDRIDGYDVLFDVNLPPAHDALLGGVTKAVPDVWPSPAEVLRLADGCSVPVAQLAGFVRIATCRIGNRVVFCDSRRCQRLMNGSNASSFRRHALVACGLYNTASALSQGGGAWVQSIRSGACTPGRARVSVRDRVTIGSRMRAASVRPRAETKWAAFFRQDSS